MSWQWFHRLGSPRWFYEKTGAWLPWLSVASILLLALGSIWALGYAPADAKQGNSYRIIFIHVPGSFLALAGYYVMAINGAIGLIWRMKLPYMMMRCAAQIGAVLTFICLFTGSLWGKPTWGAWWVWDARVTSMLVLFFLYLGIVALQQAYDNQEAADKTCAILALVGMVNIPIIYKSVDWWYTLHQPATLKLTGGSTIDPSMAYPLIWMIIAFYVTYAWLLILHTNAEILRRERKTRWVQDLVVGK
ncbi:heme ABC transporter permease [Teredinibacter sp. KSP-S5-2]|uniref:heme ABC transporter permease n=1 Tax=Teredinibacter sp. KSP-S5-2 TaxID=3034506 RepID=UPI0029348227|nr:heme ABC transporter permease [Teredinibacter sp. KSP-S5-2]WNO07706.1 heme ABC transporter permease [Teredinibacter sp. KSP-S5-2]